MRTAIAQLSAATEITDGVPGPNRRLYLAPSRTINVGGQVNTYSFVNKNKQPAAHIIDGQRVYDVDNEADAHNYAMLEFLKRMEDLDPDFDNPKILERLTLIDPDKAANEQLARDEKEMKLRNLLHDKQTDEEWLRKVYRRVIGLASGIPARAMHVALVNKAKAGVDAITGKYGIDYFSTKSGKWVFEDEYFETQSLLDYAIESAVVVRDGENYKLKSDLTKVLAHDEATMLYNLQKDLPFAEHLRKLIAESSNETRSRPTNLQVEDSELIRQARGLASGTGSPANEVQLMGQKPASDPDKEFVDLIAAVQGVAITVDADGKLVVDDVPGTFPDTAAIVTFLKGNAQVTASLKSLIDKK